MYWHWRSIPELANLPREEQDRLWKEAGRDPFRACDLGVLAVVLVILAAGSLALVWLSERLKPIWLALPVIVLVFLLMGRLADAVILRRYRPVVRRLRGGE